MMVIYANPRPKDYGCIKAVGRCSHDNKPKDLELNMDIEKYYAAFPALEKSVPVVWKRGPCQLITNSDGLLSDFKGKSFSINEKGNKGGKLADNLPSPVPHKKHNTIPASLKKHKFPLRVSHNNNNVNTSNVHNAIHSKPHVSEVKTRRKQFSKRKTKQLNSREQKPWKLLADFDFSSLKMHRNVVAHSKDSISMSTRSSEQSKAKDEEPHLIIDSSELESILGSNPPQSTTLSSDLEVIWGVSSDCLQSIDFEAKDDPTADNGSYSALAARTCQDKVIGALDAEMAGTTNSWLSEYESIERQLGSLNLCLEETESHSSSRMMRLFSTNSLCQGLLYNSMDANINAQVECAFQPSSCKHCEESYEIVLEVEHKMSEPRPYSKLFSHVDPRLNFDWTKYHPPPWIYETDSHNEMSKQCLNTLNSTCDCEFCRSRFWKHVCQYCRTPL